LQEGTPLSHASKDNIKWHILQEGTPSSHATKENSKWHILQEGTLLSHASNKPSFGNYKTHRTVTSFDVLR
jgi:hypothetical protein